MMLTPLPRSQESCRSKRFVVSTACRGFRPCRLISTDQVTIFPQTGSHVLPALIRRYDEAVAEGVSSVTNWGTGSPRREFLHVDDMASACLHLLENYDGPAQVNVGTGTDVTIKELAELSRMQWVYEGSIEWDTSKPDGTPQKTTGCFQS